ncbi:MAG TPA: putative zinc-binding metallopeptidase [Gammaproteobacteria bacterium]|nr:putative zinc-binding metallopeptidase [Gammaproteobacteria bacterium]
MPGSARASRHKSRIERWSGLSDAELLEWRFRDLGLKASNSALAPDIDHLYATLERRGIRFRPHVWLSTDWFSPDGIPGIAVPFFAVHPRLAQLERKMRGEAEGGSRRWRRRILRHEAGHALDTAYGLRRRADWRTVFGRASKPYPQDYSARPASRRFVLHLGHWYAQSHPTEDFAETFAVWLQPKARWRRDYAGWPALEKLEYVDSLMAEVAGRRPRNTDRSVVWGLSDNRRTLREHYRHQSYTDASERRYDAWLQRAFIHRAARPRALPASAFLAESESQLKRRIVGRTGTGNYLFSHVASTLRRRARELDLVLRGGRREAVSTAVRLHERVMNDLMHRNRERYLI